MTGNRAWPRKAGLLRLWRNMTITALRLPIARLCVAVTQSRRIRPRQGPTRPAPCPARSDGSLNALAPQRQAAWMQGQAPFPAARANEKHGVSLAIRAKGRAVFPCSSPREQKTAPGGAALRTCNPLRLRLQYPITLMPAPPCRVRPHGAHSTREHGPLKAAKAKRKARFLPCGSHARPTGATCGKSAFHTSPEGDA